MNSVCKDCKNMGCSKRGSNDKRQFCEGHKPKGKADYLAEIDLLKRKLVKKHTDELVVSLRLSKIQEILKDISEATKYMMDGEEISSDSVENYEDFEEAGGTLEPTLEAEKAKKALAFVDINLVEEVTVLLDVAKKAKKYLKAGPQAKECVELDKALKALENIQKKNILSKEK